jgi:hypothetical protein
MDLLSWLWGAVSQGGAVAVLVTVMAYLLLRGEISFRYPRRSPRAVHQSEERSAE